MVRKIKDNPIEKKMEQELKPIFENSREEPLQIAKYVVIVFSFIGIFSSYNQGTFFKIYFLMHCLECTITIFTRIIQVRKN